MRTRQLRLTTPDQIRARMKDFLGKKINLVCTDRRVVMAELTSFTDSEVRVLNMRKKEMRIPFNTLSEVYVDIPA